MVYRSLAEFAQFLFILGDGFKVAFTQLLLLFVCCCTERCASLALLIGLVVCGECEGAAGW